MEIIQKLVDLNLNSEYFDLEDNICFFDIETTGLSRQYNFVYLVGLMYYSNSDKSFIIEQIWIDSQEFEKDLLEYTIEKLNSFNYIINYNGNSFDVPFINKRAEFNSLMINIDSSKSFDIYSILRKNKKTLDLENLKLETVEEYLGIYREDCYSGLECIYFYLDYQKTFDSSLKDKILLHNFEDLLYLSEILVIIDILYKDVSFKMNIDNNIINLIIEEYNFSNDYLYLKGRYKSKYNYNLSNYNNNYSCTFSDNTFNISFEVSYGSIESNLKVAFVDLREFNFNINKRVFNNYKYNLPCNIALLEYDGFINTFNIQIFLTILLNDLS